MTTRNNPVYKATYRYLIKAYDHCQSVYEFEKKYIANLYKSVCKEMGEESQKQNEEEIRYALVHFYASKGIKVFAFFDRNHRIALRKKIYDPNSNLYVEKFIQHLIPFKDKLEQDKKQKNIFLLDYQSLSSFLVDILEIDSEQIRGEIIKKSIKEALELGDNDAVLLRNDKIAIRRSSYVQKKAVENAGESKNEPSQEEAPSGAERRYEGLSAEEMEQFYQNLSSKNDIKSLVTKKLNERFKDDLNFRKIDNFYFAKNFIPIFQGVINEVLQTLVDEDKVFLDGLTNFILRRYFDDMLYIVAQHLVDLVMQKDPGATSFVKFYNGETAFAADGTRYSKPDIIDNNGKRWNVSTILQIAMQRRQGLDQIARQKQSIATTTQDIGKNEQFQQKLTEKLTQMNEEKKEAEKNASDAYAEVSRLKDKVFALKTELKSSSGKRKEEIEAEIRQLSITMKEHTKKDEELHKIKRNFRVDTEKIEIRITMLKRESQSLQKKLKVETEKKDKLVDGQEPLEEKYSEMIRLLAKTLPKFRTN